MSYPSKNHGTGPIPWRYWPNTTSQYWPGTVLHTVFVLARYRFTVSGRYRTNTGPLPICLYWPSIGPILHIRIWSSTDPILEEFFGIGPVQARYRASTDLFVLVQYWTNTAHTILAQYRPNTGPAILLKKD